MCGHVSTVQLHQHQDLAAVANKCFNMLYPARQLQVHACMHGLLQNKLVRSAVQQLRRVSITQHQQLGYTDAQAQYCVCCCCCHRRHPWVMLLLLCVCRYGVGGLSVLNACAGCYSEDLPVIFISGM